MPGALTAITSSFANLAVALERSGFIEAAENTPQDRTTR